jgi:uncharacterized cupredoxin-like copper-binding protein
MAGDGSDDRDEGREVHERLALPLLIPAVVFLFAVLVIYGLSRIYLELDQWDIGDVSMATPLAIAVALAILLTATYLAGQRAVSRAQIGFIVVLGATLLTTGAIWAAAHEGKAAEDQVVAPTATPSGPVTPVAPGTVQVSLSDGPFAVTAQPPSMTSGAITFEVTNTGSILHNLRVIKTELDPGSLPIDSATFAVDESAVDVVAQLAEFDAGETQQLQAELEAGAYVLICNVPSHYDGGMRTAFTAE